MDTLAVDDDHLEETYESDDKKQKRKQAHTQAEKKRRDSIRKGYDDLASMVPACRNTGIVRMNSLGNVDFSKVPTVEDLKIGTLRTVKQSISIFSDPYMTQKLSKATILSKTIDYIERITDEKKRDENELQKLNREVKGLKIQFDEYSRLIKKTRSNPQYQSNLWNDF